jgi:hypothetical protein
MEIYVPQLSESDAAAWLDDVFEDLTKQPDVPVATYRGTYEGEPVTVQITEHVEGGDYTSVWFNAEALPWSRASACARDAHAHTGRPAVCYVEDPEAPWKMVRVTDAGAEHVDAREIAF